MIRVKICGITNFSDALLATEFGADAIGFIFAKSPRRVTQKKVKFIIEKLPPFIAKVGVFVNDKIESVNKIAKECGLDFVQLHGDETPDYCKKIMCPVIKAFRIRDKTSIKQIPKYKNVVCAFLLDSYEKGKAGGTGKTFDFNLVKDIKKFGRPVILAGGLNENNVISAIKKVKPYAVDVSSGIEIYPGKKSRVKLRNFIKKVKSFI